MDLTIIKEAAPRITAILNAYAPDGSNRGQVILYAGGDVQHKGDRSLSLAAIDGLRKRSGKAPVWQLRTLGRHARQTTTADGAE